MDFGELRGAVQASLEDKRHIGEVIWCVLMSDRREEALYYAADALAVKSYGTVNLGELVAFVVNGEPGLERSIAARFECPKVLRYEFLCAWALSVVHKPHDSPALSMDGKGRPLVMAWHNSDWEVRYDDYTANATIDRVDWSVWKGLAQHLRAAMER